MSNMTADGAMPEPELPKWEKRQMEAEAKATDDLLVALRLLLSSAVPVTADPVEYRVETQPVNERPVLFYKISVEDYERIVGMAGVKSVRVE